MAFEGSIDLYHVSKRFGDHEVLSDVCLKLSPGDFVVVRGAPGSGKTTLLKLVWGEEQPTHGHVYVGGRDLSMLSGSERQWMRRRMGIVLQDGLLIDDKSVAENLEIVLDAFHVPSLEGRIRASQTLHLVRLEERSGCPVSDLSRVERQRLALARALLNDPAIILADEPTAQLNDDMAAETMDIFSFISTRGLTILATIHDLTLAEGHDVRKVDIVNGKLEPIPPGRSEKG